MGKITKEMQLKHRDTLSPWLKSYVEAAAAIALPLLPQHLATYPTRWPFGRGDLYHWIPLLNRFDAILEAFCTTYKLNLGPQTDDFGCFILRNLSEQGAFADEKQWDDQELQNLGYSREGDRELVEAILSFSRLLLEHCGNRSIYASSAYLSDLLNSKTLSLLISALEVGSELAQRYQASVKRIGNSSRHISAALLANHYNIDLDRVQQISQAFSKTAIMNLGDPISVVTPTQRSKDKTTTQSKSVPKSHATDLVALATSPDQRWSDWGDVKLRYYPKDSTVAHHVPTEVARSSQPATPTPLRRSSTVAGPQHTPKTRHAHTDDSSPVFPRTPGIADEADGSAQKLFDLPQSIVTSSSMRQLLDKLPDDMTEASRYEAFHRFRVAKALTGSQKDRQQILGARLLAITNLAYIHTESSFMEKVLRQDMDETRRYQLAPQLAELIQPSSDGNTESPLWLQTIAFSLLEALYGFPCRSQDVLSALNANVNHGVLLYVIRKAVAGMEETHAEDEGDQVTETDNWRNNLFSLALNLSMATKIGSEMASAGLMEILVHVLNIRSSVAERHHSMVLAFLDGLIWAFTPAFTAFFSADGLDAVSKLLVDTVIESKRLVSTSKGITQDQQSSAVDFFVPHYQQQTLKWLLKFIHRIMSNSYNYSSGNTERLLRNLAEKSDLLAGLRDIISDKASFGSTIWTNSVLILSDFINNDPTSYAAISESGMIKTYLEAITRRSITDVPQQNETRDTQEDSADASEGSDVIAMIQRDERPHPPTEEMLRTSKHDDAVAAGILVSSDAISVVPQVLNSISLNNSGMKLVASSRAFDSFLEIFESPEHVRCMEIDLDLPQAIGQSFDELARHHPPLRTAISNAVIDMVAKVRYLGIRKAEQDNWGVRLLGTDNDGKVVSIDQDGRVAERNEVLFSPREANDSDVTMGDPVTHRIVGDSTGETLSTKTPDTITPYILVLANFLHPYLSTTFIKTYFIEKGGVELLLDICELPSLPANYSESRAAKAMTRVVAHLTEHAPVRSLPSILKRTQASIDVLKPLSTRTDSVPPYFGPFLTPDVKVPSSNLTEPMLSGTRVVKALLNSQIFLKILADCFSKSRSHSLQFFPVNVFDYYLRLIKSIGPLLRGVLAEEAGQLAAVPQHWSIKRGGSSHQGESANTAPAGNESTSLPDVMNSTGAWKPAEGAEAPRSPTEEEKTTARFHNYETLKLLLHPMIPTWFPLFQSIGKSLVPRREVTHGDLFPRPRHLELAKELASTVLDQLSPSISTPNPTAKEFHFWIIMTHTIHEMFIQQQSGRQPDRPQVHIILPVLLAFKEQGGIDVINTILRIFTKAVREGSDASRFEERSKAKVAAFGLNKVLELYALLVNGKNLVETSNHFNLQRHTDRNQVVPNIYQQIVVEFRCAILPPMLEIWNSSFVEHVSDETAKRILDILKQIATAENEPASTPKDKAPFALLNYSDVRFDWRVVRAVISDLLNAGFDLDLAREAVFRANGNITVARDYCRAHKAGLAGTRNPIPPEDDFFSSSKTPETSRSRQRAPSTGSSASEPDRMSVDTFTEVLDRDGAVDTGNTSIQAPDPWGTTASADRNQNPEQGNKQTTNEAAPQARFSGTKEELDGLRLKIRSNLIDHSLDVIRAHSDCAIEVSQLIQTMALRHQAQETHEEVGTVLTSALSSLALDADEKKKNGKCIAAYSHLLGLLLDDQAFFDNNIDGLRDKVGEYVDFLKVQSPGAIEELPPWIPYVLLVLEPLLKHDERPVAAQWLAPRTVDDPVQPAVVQLGVSLINDQQRLEILEALLVLLPRVGKQEALATSILRVLVILTRRRQLAKHMGQKMNLQRLFLMAKQLAGFGSERLKHSRVTAFIITILRHVVEDEETLRQIIRAEIKSEFPNVQRNNRGPADVSAYLRALAPIALRAPELFVEVSNEMLQFSRWSPAESDTAGRLNTVTLKDGISTSEDSAPPTAVEESKDLPGKLDAPNTADQVKPSTELVDKEMADAPKVTDSKRPVVENPDGVVHFLLCELVNYREVDDKEPTTTSKDTQAELDLSDAGSEQMEREANVGETGDKRQAKPQFKSEEHPIYVYRCFLLNCLSELLQSYTRTKVEFINFKRSAPPVSTGTPIKPRTGILNYLIYDLLCQGNLAGTADNIVAKKKLATSAQTQRVLVALVSKTSEKPGNQGQEKFAYDDEPDLLFVRKFVLDTILRAYERAPLSDEPLETRYSRMQSLAELMMHMIGDRDKDQPRQGARSAEKNQSSSQAQIRRLMYEKGYLDKLTASIAELSLNYPGVKRAIKYILRVLRILTDTAKELSHSNLLPSDPGAEQSEEEYDESSSSLSDLEEDREETPDLYRNSALGMLEPRDEDDDSESEDEDEDADMYGDEYDEEMDYGDEEMSDGEDDISDDDEELGDMGDIEGLHGEPGVVEVIMDDDEDDDEDDEDDEESDDDDDSAGSAEMEDMEDRVEIVDEDGNPVEDDSAWESESEMDENEDHAAEDVDYEAEVQDEEEAHIHGLGPGELLNNMARAIMGDDDGYGQELLDGLHDHYLDEDQVDIDDGEEEEEELEDEEYFDEAEFYAPEDHVPHLPSAGWDGMGSEIDDRHRLLLLENNRRPVFTRVENRGGPPTRFVGTHRDAGDFRSYFSRMQRPAGQHSHPDDGSNPLLRRHDTEMENSSRQGILNSFGLRLPETILTGGRHHMIDGPMHFIGELMEFLPMMSRSHPGQAIHVQISRPGAPRGEFAPIRTGRYDSRREVSQEPHQVVGFNTEPTISRYSQEASMLFGPNYLLESAKLSNAISAALTPAAVELQKKAMAVEEENRKRAEEMRQKAEAEQKEKEAQEAEERAERERQETEERQRQATVDAATAADAGSAQESEHDTAMEGVESASTGQPASQPGASSAPRVTTTIRGEEVDITELGIDADYLAALPEEFREEVIAQTVSERRSQALETAPDGESTEVFQEFLDALPEDLRLEIAQQERQERRRREGNRRQAASAGISRAVEMDTASILQTFPPELRDEVLLQQGQSLMDQLTPELAAQSRALHQHQPPASLPRVLHGAPPPHAEAGKELGSKAPRRAVVQMLDKAGVATLLRLMFITHQGSFRSYLFSVFADVCENRQSRLEVISTLLQILQDGSTDINAVERSFGQLSIKAKRLKDKDRDAEPRTPLNLKRTLTSLSTPDTAQPSSETSPLLIVQQCLDLLVDLCARNPHIPWLFLTEHEAVGASLRKALGRKGKGKDSKASKYAINALLALLERELITESASVMTYLADLLNRVTLPLQNLERRRRESLDAATTPTKRQGDSRALGRKLSTSGAADEPSANDNAPKAQKQSGVPQRRSRPLQPPIIPEENLTLVVRIFVARECSSKTFQNTIATIKNLCAIPGTKAIFGQELIRQARALSENIVTDLTELLPHILAASSGTEIQGVALAKFSPGASDQNKLLRVLTALDHLFEPKKKPGQSSLDKLDDGQYDDLLTSLYHHQTFLSMWDKLGNCLSAIRQRENMLSVATILLPLIESLMVVCKNTTTKDDTAPSQQPSEDRLSNSVAESQTANLFLSFTEEHRRVLNELVRHSPKLMSGTFALLVRNPKVLEFDNKRNYFNRTVHSRAAHGQSRPTYPTLQLKVRRESVYRDSFTNLYYKDKDEIKYGKLNIRFDGEEGVDAGGVTREWFQVLARQMFDPNNALFIPVSSDRTTFHPNKLSKWHLNDGTDGNGESTDNIHFKFIGRIIGKALYEGRLLDCFFSRAVYKRILGKSVSVKDMESFDPDYYKSLCWMLENDITDIITETFSEEEDEFGVTKIVDLVPNGREIPVTEENKQEYVRLVVEHRLLTSVKDQMESFLNGFHEIIPAELISIFNEQELELLISGLPDIDIDDWRSNTEYHNYTPSSQQVQWFWRAVRSFDKEELAKLLQFVTGTSKVPLNGFKELEGMNGISRFNIHRDYGDKDRLPTSHTCFNQLDLPEYDSYDVLRAQLHKAITAGNEYFGFA